MKKIVTTAGLAALGVVSMQAAPDVGLTPSQTSKPWSLSANLRGFYDDNITTAPNAIAEDSVGIEFSPAISLNLVMTKFRLIAGLNSIPTLSSAMALGAVVILSS